MHRRALKVIDKPFVTALAVLVVFGLVILTSASSGIKAGAPFYYLQKQLISLAIGVVLVLVMLNVDYSLVSRYNALIYVGTNILLIVVLVFGTEQRGLQGWLSIGGFNFQVAEFAKILFILCFADFLAKRQGMIHTLRDMFPCFIYIGLPVLLVTAQPDLGTALVFIAIAMGMMFVAGANLEFWWGSYLERWPWLYWHCSFTFSLECGCRWKNIRLSGSPCFWIRIMMDRAAGVRAGT